MRFHIRLEKNKSDKTEAQRIIFTEAFDFNLQEHPWLDMPLEDEDPNIEAMRFALDEIRAE